MENRRQVTRKLLVLLLLTTSVVCRVTRHEVNVRIQEDSVFREILKQRVLAFLKLKLMNNFLCDVTKHNMP